MGIQEIIALILVVAAVIYAVRGFIKVFITKKSTACGCDSCDLKDNTKDIRSLTKQKTNEQHS